MAITFVIFGVFLKKSMPVWWGNDSAMHFYEKQGLKPRNIHMETVL